MESSALSPLHRLPQLKKTASPKVTPPSRGTPHPVTDQAGFKVLTLGPKQHISERPPHLQFPVKSAKSFLVIAKHFILLCSTLLRPSPFY